VLIWDAETGAALREPLEGYTNLVTSVAFSPVGRSFLSDCNDCTICPWNVDCVTNGPPLQCSCSVKGWGLLNVGSSSMRTFGMDSLTITVPSPQVLFCISPLANTQWLGLLSSLGTPFLAPNTLQGWTVVSTHHTCYRPRTDLALIWQVCIWCRLGKVLFPSKKPLLKNKIFELYLSWSLSSHTQLFSYAMEPDCSTTQVITLIPLRFTPQYPFLPHLPSCINPYSLNAPLLVILLTVY
jgi:WD40 repeat protein